MTLSAIKLLGFIVSAAVLVLACVNTKLTDTHVSEDLRGKSVSDILVIMVTDDDELREPFEDGFVAQFKATGVDAVSSTHVIAIPGDQKLEKDVILKAINDFQNDAVLITHLVDVEKYEASNSPTASSGGFYGYYDYAYNYVHAPGIYSSHTHNFVRLETNLYNVEIEKSMWTGRAESSTWHPKSDKRIIEEMIKVVIKDLQRNKMIPSK